nr:retrovirus-related Pol polyprotein from transposon TNT 1-94 [Tanacetum cinerariifolium]
MQERCDSGEEDDEKAKYETCLMAQALNEICLGVDMEPNEWIKDSGCSKHMTGNRKLFLTYKAYNGGNVIFGSNLHASKELVRNLPKLKFDQHFCDGCKIRKQAHASHKAKNIVSTTRCLELLHMDVFGLSAVRSYGENLYTLVIVDDYSSFPKLSNDRYILCDRVMHPIDPYYERKTQLDHGTKRCRSSNPSSSPNVLDHPSSSHHGYKKKIVMVTSNPLALVAKKMNVSKRKEKVVVSSDSKGSGADDFNELKKITFLLAKAFNRRKFYSKPTNNNLRTSSTSQSANKKQEFVKSDEKKEDKKSNEKKRDMSKVKCYNCKKEGYFAKDCKKAKVLLESDESSSSAEETIIEVSYYTSESESESEFETLEYYDNSTNYGLFVNNYDDQGIFHDAIESASEKFIENHIDSQKDYDKSV